MVELKKLNLKNNNISAIEADSFLLLNKLKHLSLQENQLTKLSNGMFSGLIALKFLDLSVNKIQVVEDDAFLELVSLNHLKLFGNMLTTLEKHWFRNVSRPLKMPLSEVNCEQKSYNGTRAEQKYNCMNLCWLKHEVS